MQSHDSVQVPVSRGLWLGMETQEEANGLKQLLRQMGLYLNVI